MHSRGEFIKIGVASFVSQSGSHFLSLALASFIYITSGSVVRGALVFVFSYLPSVLISGWAGGWIDRHISRRLLALGECTSIIVSAACGLCLSQRAPLAVLCTLLAVRSVLLFVTRTGTGKWIKVISPPELQEARIKLFFLIFFLSTAFSGICAASVLQRNSVWLVVSLDIATYLVSLSLYLTLRPLPEETAGVASARQHALESLLEILQAPALRTAFLAICFSQALFQGAYSVLISYIPIEHLRVGLRGVGWFQLAASAGIICGFLANWAAPELLFRGRSKVLAMLALALAGLIGSVYTTDLRLSLVAFFSLNLGYEVVWLAQSAAFFRATPKDRNARLQFTLTASASFLMAIFTLAYSSSITAQGSPTGVLLVAAIGLGLWLVGTIMNAKPTYAAARSA